VEEATIIRSYDSRELVTNFLYVPAARVFYSVDDKERNSERYLSKHQGGEMMSAIKEEHLSIFKFHCCRWYNWSSAVRGKVFKVVSDLYYPLRRKSWIEKIHLAKACCAPSYFAADIDTHVFFKVMPRSDYLSQFRSVFDHVKSNRPGVIASSFPVEFNPTGRLPEAPKGREI
jgi:hypothetical protein